MPLVAPMKLGQSVFFRLVGLDLDNKEQPITDAVMTVDPRLEVTMGADGLSGVIKAIGTGKKMRIDVAADADIGPGAPVMISGSDEIDVDPLLAVKVALEFGIPTGP